MSENGLGHVDGQDRRRNGTFTWTGHALASLLLLAFVVVYGVAFYQLDGWKAYFFDGAINLREQCRVAYYSTSSLANTFDKAAVIGEEAISVPHQQISLRGKLASVGQDQGDKMWARYTCVQPTSVLQQIPGVTYLHVGWVFADHTDIVINDLPRVSFSGRDKPIVPLSLADTSGESIRIEITSYAKNADLFGIVGAAPMVIAQGNVTNGKILGIETALQNVRYLHNLLPILTLGLVLVWGWFYGIRSRLMISTFVFFLYSAARSMVMVFADLWPWDSAFCYVLQLPFNTGASLAFYVFAMQVLGIQLRYLSYMMTAIAVIVAAEITALFLVADPWTIFPTLETAQGIISVVSSIALVITGHKHIRNEKYPKDRLVVSRFLLVTIAVFGLVQLTDFIFAQTAVPIRLSLKVDVVMPIFVGGFLLYTLSLIEKHFHEERNKRVKMEHDLHLAQEIQDSLQPPVQALTGAGLRVSCYQQKHSQVAGDWMAIRSTTDALGNEGLVAVVADATGKGMQAALVVHAVQSLWADALFDVNFNASDWIQRVNRTLLKLGERKAHSMTLGIIELQTHGVTYWSAGHLPLYVVTSTANGDQQVKPMVATGSVLGLKKEISFKPATMEWPNENVTATLMLGSDGVFAKGSRTNRREVQDLLARLRLDADKALSACDADDDKTLVVIDSVGERGSMQVV